MNNSGKVSIKNIPKWKLWVSQALLEQFLLLITFFKLAPKSIYQSAQFQFQKAKCSSSEGGTDTPCEPVGIFDIQPQNGGDGIILCFFLHQRFNRVVFTCVHIFP